MPTYTIYKDLRLKVQVEAPSAREAYDAQMHLDDNTFEVIACDYEVLDENEDFVDPEEYE